MSATAELPLQQAASKPAVNPWLIGIVVSLAAFMEVLDSSIANVALPHIAGNVGASNDESTWVLTSYLVANAIVLPITGFLVNRFGRKRFFLTCILFFTVSSFICGMAPTLGLLLLFRIAQGAFGGGLQPMAQAILADTFPPHQRGLAFALYGVTAVCGPVLGPTLGGWITDNYSWRWIFYINVPVGLLSLLLVHLLLEDPPYLSRVKKQMARFDFVGFSLLTVGVAALQIMLDKGQEDDWFSSGFISTLAVLAVVGLASLVLWELRQKEPIVDIRLFRNFNFATSNVMFLAFGAALFSSTVLLPQLLQTLMGYTAEQAGLVLSSGALAVLLFLPLVGQLTNRIQARHLIAIGWLQMAISMYISSRHTDLLMTFGHATYLRILQTLALPFLFVPLTLAAYVGLPSEKTNTAAGLMNFTRNMGQSIGTSALTTVLARRNQFHQFVLSDYSGLPRFQTSIPGLAGQLAHKGLSTTTATQQATARLYNILQNQASSISYLDAYWMLAMVGAVMFLSSFLLKPNNPGKDGTVAVH